MKVWTYDIAPILKAQGLTTRQLSAGLIFNIQQEVEDRIRDAARDKLGPLEKFSRNLTVSIVNSSVRIVFGNDATYYCEVGRKAKPPIAGVQHKAKRIAGDGKIGGKKKTLKRLLSDRRGHPGTPGYNIVGSVLEDLDATIKQEMDDASQ